MATRLTRPDRELIDSETHEIWNDIFHRFDNDITFSTDDAATFATAAADAVRVKMTEMLSIWTPCESEKIPLDK